MSRESFGKGLLAVAATVLVSSAAGFAVAAQEDEGPPPGKYEGSSDSLFEQLGDRATGERASEGFPAETREKVENVPVKDRLDYRPVSCESLALNEEFTGCITGEVSDEIRAIDPKITTDDIRDWDGSKVQSSGVQAARCEALIEVGYKGPHCEGVSR